MEIVRIQNNATSKTYDVSPDGWQKIIDQGWGSRYTVVYRRETVKPSQPSFIPREIQEGAKEAASRAIMAEEENHAGRRPAQK